MKKITQYTFLMSLIFCNNIWSENTSYSSSGMHIAENIDNRDFFISEVNKEALIDCLESRYEKALDSFNRSLFYSYNKDKKQFSIALWGKLICDAYLEDWQAMYLDIDMLEMLLDSCCEDCYSATFESLPIKNPIFFANLKRASSNFFNTKIALINDTGFAFPDEILTRDQCYARVRMFTLKIQDMISAKFSKKENTPDNCYALDKFWTFLYKISRRGEDCCYKGTHWTVCCGPINQIWRTWKNEGVPDYVSE